MPIAWRIRTRCTPFGDAGNEPPAYLQRVSSQLETLTTRDRIEPVADELEHMFEILDP